jgi:hypothetical protein
MSTIEERKKMTKKELADEVAAAIVQDRGMVAMRERKAIMKYIDSILETDILIDPRGLLEIILDDLAAGRHHE